MADVQQAIASAFGVMNLKPRSASQILESLKADGFEASLENGFLSVSQTGTQMNVATVLQSYFKKHPEQFVGHSGEIKFKSDLGNDSQAKSRLIAERGFQWWNDLPANPQSPTAKDVVKPVIASTEMKRSEWLQLTPAEKSAALDGWGAEGLSTVERIMGRK